MDESSIPSCSNPVDDCRINCLNSESLRNIVNITVKNVSELVAKDLLKEQKSEFVNQFSEIFKNALQQNTIVNELPWVADQNKLSTPEMEDHEQMIDDAVLNQLCKTVARVAHKRKFAPQQCVRIANIKMKHCVQNLKKAKVEESSQQSLSPLKTMNKDHSHLKTFSDFCKDFVSAQEAVEQKLRERDKLLKKINVASSVKLQQKTVLKSIITDETIAVANR